VTSVSTHVLDTARGCPAAGVPVSIEIWAEGTWRRVGGSVTDADGRAGDLPALDVAGPVPGRLIFAVRDYLVTHHGAAFFPDVTVVFMAAPGEHYHLPLLLAPFGYSVYRGS
jgi:hydroxyisourate hydrolase